MTQKGKINITRSKAWNETWNFVFSYARRYPNYYAALMLPLGLAGYVYLMFFPVLVVTSIGKMINIFSTTPFSQIDSQLGGLVFWFGAFILSAITTWQIINIKFKLPEGIDITPAIASNLHQLLQRTQTEISIPNIDRIIITEQLSIDVAKTPMFQLPFWSTNTLVVGLPLMQCLSPDYFKCAVIRKLLQYSKQRHTIPKFLHQLRNTWSQYSKYFWATTNKNIFLSGFFGMYASVYRHLSIPVANHVELLADQDTLDIINDEDLLQTIEKVIVSKIYLEKQYWPKIQRLVKQDRYALIEPYSRLEQVLRSGLTPQLSKQWLDSLYSNQSKKLFPVPDLRSRMNNIGRHKIRIPEKTNETAASYYLNSAYRDIISEVNHLWLLRSNKLTEQAVPANQASTGQARPAISPATTKKSRLSPGLFN